MIKVYHTAMNTDRFDLADAMSGNTETIRRLWSQGSYQHVATVSGDDFDFAYRYTNNIDDSWSLEPISAVEPHNLDGEYGHRSTCVGDIMERDGKLYFVARKFGYTEVF